MPAYAPSPLFLVSACLCGKPCRYDGESRPHPFFADVSRYGLAVPVCPEMLGGLPVPRAPAEISRGRVMDRDGRDVTEAFALGAARALETARDMGITAAVLKERSPSCGVAGIYDGTFSGRVIPGSGVTTALLRASGISVYSEENFMHAPCFGAGASIWGERVAGVAKKGLFSSGFPDRKNRG